MILSTGKEGIIGYFFYQKLDLFLVNYLYLQCNLMYYIFITIEELIKYWSYDLQNWTNSGAC